MPGHRTIDPPPLPGSALRPRIGLALGSGSARGWSHIGVIQALSEIGVVPDIVCGTSIGSLVGAAYVSGRLDLLEQWVCQLSRRDVAGFFEISLSLDGFVDIERLQSFLEQTVVSPELRIEELEKSFAAVATELESGREVWFSQGRVIEAVMSSIALPGLFPPQLHNGRWLVDGGLVNPVPVSVCRALGAEVVIAVNLNGDIVGKHFAPRALDERKAFREQEKSSAKAETLAEQVKQTLREYSSSLFNGLSDRPRPPNIFETLAGSVNITQDRITRSRMAGDPPDITLVPRLAQIGLLDFHRAKEAIQGGRRCVVQTAELIQEFVRPLQ
ncbi:MAG: patatin-like phospholipase RssA [Desulfuromonadaceae bacterium]|nr:patatin-like phospholipase RssA [Desulfuromonadaceae bacterium]